MSRVGKKPITVGAGVTVTIDGQDVTGKGGKGSLSFRLHPDVAVAQEDGALAVRPAAETVGAWAQAGTARAVLANMVKGVSQGFERRLTLVGVGYRAQAKGRTLGLSLGFSHPVDYAVPEGVDVVTPTQTEIVITGADRQKVGQVAADIRRYRPPEPYKGKGIRYSDEQVLRKEAKKK
jgi:large subunit ribosomal protein L6